MFFSLQSVQKILLTITIRTKALANNLEAHSNLIVKASRSICHLEGSKRKIKEFDISGNLHQLHKIWKQFWNLKLSSNFTPFQ